MRLQTKFKAASIKRGFRQARATFFKRGNRSTPKNAAIAQENAALDAFYGRMFKTRPLVCALSRVF